jgi:RTX calcium-binding nonapeptide repeat (4 copies)
MLSSRRTLIAILTIVGSLYALTAAAPASADPAWGCRASVGYLAPSGADRVEPFVANGNANTSQVSPDRDRCADDEARASGDITVGPVTQRNPVARTSIDPDTGESAAQSVLAETQADSTALSNGDGSFRLTTDDVRAQAAARCVGGVPTFSGSSSVTNVTLNGQSMSADGTLEQIGTGLNGSPLGGLIRVVFNEEERSAEGLVRRAVHVTIKNAAGQVVFEAVAGEAKVSRREAVCVLQGAPPFQCPEDAVYDVPSGLCVKTVIVPEDRTGSGGVEDGSGRGACPEGFFPTGDGNCVKAVPVDDAGNPLGGSVVPYALIPGGEKSICRNRRFGRLLVAIRGTSRRDNVTGTNTSDRIFVLRRGDFVSGGRGNDCIEGGRGRNRLDGSTGSDYLLGHKKKDAMVGGPGADRLFGRAGSDRMIGDLGNDYLTGSSGSDKIVAGPGRDRIRGGKGRDYISTATGPDRVVAGSGNDVINAASEGPPAHIKCGAGRDTVRINRSELRHLRGCERVFVVARHSGR